LETPIEALDSWLTPIDRFFIRSHFEAPAIEKWAPWHVRIEGLVAAPQTLTLDEIKRRGAVVERPALLQCAGNGRSFFKPTIPGVPWAHGAIGQAEWTGIRLRELLEPMGLDGRARHVHIVSADLPPHPKTPAYLRSLPIDRAMDSGTMVAWSMNGEALPWQHGGPLRLVVPGWTGNHWIKWVCGFVVSDVEAPGFYQRTGYRMPLTPQPPDAVLKAEELAPVAELVVKSLICRPTPERKLVAGRSRIEGFAWTGPRRVVSRVDVQIDDGPWVAATLDERVEADCWRGWRMDWVAGAGKHTIAARATDSAGETQPATTPWNRSGYLWNGIQTVSVEVTEE
jgi:DMSO/TMAO reductase YedYZ molybdopterin-dependent catalytic subunit